MQRLILPSISFVFASACAGCAGMPSDSFSGPAVAGQASLTMAHYAQLAVHPDRRPSYMQPDAGKKSALIYGGDWATNDVFVYDYASGKQVGTLTGFSEPYGMCVDAKGDTYIANFGAANVVEYAHGGSSAINTYPSGGEPMGCAVDAKGDVAVTSFDPGDVVVFARGDPAKSTTYTGPCTYLWTMGYDDKGNLVGVGEESTGSIVACALLSGSKSMTTLSGCCTGPITMDFPGGTTWDGKYIALGDQEAGINTGVWRASLSGTTLVEHGETILGCDSGYADVLNPFFVGNKNTPANRKRATVVVGANLSCGMLGGSGIDVWHYPAGGDPFKVYGGSPYGAGVSLKS